MSATVLPFPRRGEPRVERSPTTVRNDNRALFDARQINDARAANDDWTARLLLALLQTLSGKEMDLLEFRLLGRDFDGESARQALAIVQTAKGTNAHRERVRHMLERMHRED